MSHIVLEEVTNLEILKFAYKAHSESWSGLLSSEQYIDRELQLRSQSKQLQTDTSPYGLFLYILRDLQIPSENETDNIVTTGEVLIRKSWRIDGDDVENLKIVNSGVIGNVFTLKNHRGKGYATQLFHKLNELLDEKLGKDGYSFLYSEVGTYYEKFGFKNFNIKTHTISIKDYKIDDEHLSNTEPLKLHKYKDLINYQKDKLEKSFLQKAKTLPKDESIISLIPNVDIYDWINEKDQLISTKLFPNSKVDNYGILDLKTKNHFIWLHDFSSKKLYIIKSFINEESNDIESLKNLVYGTIKEAQLYGIEKIHFWDTSIGQTLKYHDLIIEWFKTEFNDSNISLFEEIDSIPAIRMNDGKSGLKIHWENNEKWSWY
ncbi:hypothetical protein BN7_6035 [Wickerhamomyces ciferrii]|uniref:Uncharacterized protein n=1 Tax=Wickerhamomyces ciferrii (strain ATCC 14091 / BCRC 22168 / CBS 111 / JCM 3599 / NBRC 0793 / NRRL Y-1031 F-60-10) TaxID=1206466 RepID=K0KTE9_WICCF|nr:uncharacterized protein BN7_6035 [Wickerhamomyces ciferrii]CCH46441.1 hypothetical protein BN7_6035 [Wickerhamomyces ciferrii]